MREGGPLIIPSNAYGNIQFVRKFFYLLLRILYEMSRTDSYRVEILKSNIIFLPFCREFIYLMRTLQLKIISNFHE